MTRISIAESTFTWALSRVSNPDEIETRFPKLAEWMNGQSQPTLKQLEKFAKATCTPFGALFLSTPPEYRLHIPHFRTLDDKHPHQASPNLIETTYTMERRQSWLREHLIDSGIEPIPFIKSASIEETADKIAEKMRAALGLEIGWAERERTWSDALQLLRTRMDESGVLVVINGIVGNNTHRKLNPEEFRGFVLVDDYAPLVFVNGADWKSAQIFTLAHEMAHLILGSSAAFDLRGMLPAEDKIEQLCNQAAAEFLVPRLEFEALWPKLPQGEERFQAAARHFKVSVIVVARRALDLHLISRDEFFVFYENYNQAQKKHANEREAGGGDFHAVQNYRLSKNFAEAVIRAVRQGQLLYREAYQLTGLYGKTFETYASTLGYGVGI